MSGQFAVLSDKMSDQYVDIKIRLALYVFFLGVGRPTGWLAKKTLPEYLTFSDPK